MLGATHVGQRVTSHVQNGLRTCLDSRDLARVFNLYHHGDITLGHSLVNTSILVLFEICQHILGYIAHPPWCGALLPGGKARGTEDTLEFVQGGQED